MTTKSRRRRRDLDEAMIPAPHPRDILPDQYPATSSDGTGAAPGDYEWEIQRLDAALADQTGRSKP